MRATFWTVAVAVVATLPLAGPTWAARPIPPEYQVLLCNWYLRYLGRPIDPPALQVWGRKLVRGDSPREVEAAILGGREYFARNGGTKIGYIRGLFRDILATEPADGQLEYWLEELSDLGYRDDLAEEFLEKARKLNPVAPPVVFPQPHLVPLPPPVTTPPPL